MLYLLLAFFFLVAFRTDTGDAFHLPHHHARRVTTTISLGAATAGAALYDAAYSGNLDKMKAIISESKGNKETLNWRNMERYGRTPLVIASYYNKADAVQLLLSTPGVDPNLGSDFGATALHFAAHRGHLQVVKALLQDKRTKVNVLATGGKWEGKTALDVTSGMGMSGSPEIIEALKAKGAKNSK